MQPPKSMRIERKDTSRTRFYAVLFAVVSIACAIGLFLTGVLVAKVGALVCAAIALHSVRANLAFARSLELVGDRVLFHPLWSNNVRIHHELCSVTVRLVLVKGEAPPRLAGDYFTLRFADGRVLVQTSAFPDGEDFVSRLVVAAAGAVALPLRLGDAAMQQWVRFPDQPALGVTAGYRHADGTLVAINACAGEAERGARINAPEVKAVFERALAELEASSAKKRVAFAVSERGTTTLAGLEFLYASLVMGSGPKEAKSELYLRGWEGNLLKVWVTEAPGSGESREATEATLAAFLRANEASS